MHRRPAVAIRGTRAPLDQHHIEAAHERDMSVVALTGARGGRLAQLLRDTDVHVCVPHELPARILEVHHLVLHCICDGVDAQLLGLPDTLINEQENLA